MSATALHDLAHGVTSADSLESLWMPFTPNRVFKRAPRLLASAKDMHYTTVDGRQILDAAAGLWCVNAGHGRTPIVEAIRTAAGELDFAPSFQMGHPLAFEFASRLADKMPGDLDHVFFANSGSEAVDTALKIALAYHQARGDVRRTRLVGRSRGYHGVGFGGISVGGIDNNRKQFPALLPGVSHLPDTHDPARNAFSRGQPAHGAERADALEALVREHGDTIAAVIVEPVAASTGVLVPPIGYLERLRAICDKHGILLIFDEVITGFGRLGAPFAAEYFGILPDIMSVAKGLTNGSVPMGAAIVRHGVYEGVLNGTSSGIEFFHGYTYSGHPLAAAAGMAALDVYEQEGLLTRAASLNEYWTDAVHSLRGLPHVIDLRNLGLMAGVELEPRPDAPATRAYDVFTDCFAQGVMMRTTGDTVALSPPLIVERHHIDQMFETLGRALERVA